MIRLISIFIICFLNLALFSQAPDTLWTKTFGGDSDDSGFCVDTTSDGGYIITGRTYSFGAGSGDVWLIKTDANGDTLWTKTFGGTDNDIGRSVQQTTDGGYIIIGDTRSFGVPNRDVWLIKTNANGDTLWTKTYDAENRHNKGYSVHQTPDGGFIIAGTTQRPSPIPGLGPYDVVWLIKTDANGDTLWTKIFEESEVWLFYSAQQTDDGGYIITASSNTLLIKTDVNGDTAWTKALQTGLGISVLQTMDGGYIISGVAYNASDDVWLIKTDVNGDTLWTKTFDRSETDIGYSVDQTIDGGYIITGYSGSSGSGDVWLIKTNANGDTLWTKTFGGNGFDHGFSVRQTTDGGYVITGYTESFGNGSGDVWLIKIAPDVTAIDGGSQTIINNYQLQQNYPNPFNPTSTIQFSIPKSEFVTLKVYNILGEEVATLVSEILSAGSYKYGWPARSSGGDASSLASGVYLYRIQAGDFVEVKKMILMR